jgi:hypothetical protein
MMADNTEKKSVREVSLSVSDCSEPDCRTMVSRGIALPFLDRGIIKGSLVNSTPHLSESYQAVFQQNSS